MRGHLGILSALFLVAAAPVLGQLPDGYTRAEAVPLPERLEAVYADGRVTLTVRRAVGDSVSRSLVHLAESLVPDPAAIEAEAEAFLASRIGPGQWPENFAEARDQDGPRWAWMQYEELIPFALHGNAAAHFIERFHEMARTRSGGSSYFSLEISYLATVDPHPDDGHLVTLILDYEKWCGSLCGFRFTHERRVHIASDGTVLRIEGDGPTAWAMS